MNRDKLISFSGLLLVLTFAISSSCKERDEITSLTKPDNGKVKFNHEFGTIIDINGTWDLAEGNKGTIPEEFSYSVTVPGLVTSAVPKLTETGLESDRRDSYYFRRKFRIEDDKPGLVRLKIGKSLFGAEVWLNGERIGESSLSFVPLYFDITSQLKDKGSENELVIRTWAHISELPDTVVTGGDPERRRYPAGIYDNVEIILSNPVYVKNVQVAPDIKNETACLFITIASANGSGGIMKLDATVTEFSSGIIRGSEKIRTNLPPNGEEIIIKAPIKISNCKLWTPDEPNLYVLTITDGDFFYRTRFGMRSFSVDSSYTNRALLNGKTCFIRGTNFAIHRFFEDSLCGELPWNEKWVSSLFRKYRDMGMNGVRFVISPAPDMWYDIADQEGMIVFDEYAIWYAYQPDVGDVSAQRENPIKKWGIWPEGLTTERLAREYEAWMKERWNHPSICVWDAQNETWAKETGEAIKMVRHLDHSGRPWDNGWSPPVSESDIREAHPYFEGFIQGTEMKSARQSESRPFTLSDITSKEKLPSTFYLPYQSAYGLPHNWYWQQPCIINEYSYLWLKRNGEPTTLTKKYYDSLLGENATPDQRRELYARYLAAVTEYWRATRSCFGILYPFGLAASLEECETSDSFIDIPKLTFDDYYMKYVPDAFAPLGVCAELWKEKFIIREWWGTQAEFPVAIINDTEKEIKSSFKIRIRKDDIIISENTYSYTVDSFGLNRIIVKIDLPGKRGKYVLETELYGGERPVISRRNIEMTEE